MPIETQAPAFSSVTPLKAPEGGCTVESCEDPEYVCPDNVELELTRSYGVTLEYSLPVPVVFVVLILKG